jgi:hypothetical protein
MDKKDYQVYLIRDSTNNDLFSGLKTNLENFKLYRNPSMWKNFHEVRDKPKMEALTVELETRLKELEKDNREKNKELTENIRKKIMVRDIEKTDNIHVYKSPLNESKRCKVIKMLHFKQFNFTLLGELKHNGIKPKKSSGTSFYKLIKIIGEQKIYREQLSSFIFENSSSTTNS